MAFNFEDLKKRRDNPSHFSEEIYRENERFYNRWSAYALLILGVSFLVITLLDLFWVLDLGGPICTMLVFISSVISVGGFIISKVDGYSSRWLKSMIITILLVTNAVLFFLFPFHVQFILYGPVLFSAVYYNTSLILKTSIINYLIYSAALWGNVIADKGSDLMKDYHNMIQAQVWSSPVEVLTNYYIPHTLFFIITVVLCYTIASREKMMVEKQTKYSEMDASVNAQLQTAANIQRSSLPRTSFVTKNKDVVINAYMRPAKEVGGDFYDYFQVGSNIAFLVADVSDKGIPAAMYMMRAKNMIRSALHIEDTIEEAIISTNRMLCKENDESIFLTILVGIIDPKTGVGKYVNCGHLPPYIKHKDGSITKLESDPDLFIGAFEDIEITSHYFELEETDTIFIYTDGLTDAENEENELFGKDRLEEVIASVPAYSENICEKIVSRIDSYIDKADQFDDMTCLSLKVSDFEKAKEFSKIYDAKEASVESLIDEINEILASNGCPEDIRRNIDVAIDEIGINIVDYAYEGKDGDFRVEAKSGSNYIEISFIDSGIAFNPLEVNDPEFSVPPTIGGLGIHLVRNLMDEISYKRENDQNILYLFKIWNM